MAHAQGTQPAAGHPMPQFTFNEFIATVDARVMARVAMMEENIRVRLEENLRVQLTHETHTYVAAQIAQLRGEVDSKCDNILAVINKLNDRMRDTFEAFKRAFGGFDGRIETLERVLGILIQDTTPGDDTTSSSSTPASMPRSARLEQMSSALETLSGEVAVLCEC